MKKLLVLMAAAIMAVSASAQVMTSRTMIKKKNPTMWYGRIGMSINNIAGGNDFAKDQTDEDFEATIRPKVGMEVDFGFHKPISSAGLYWGMELGIGTRGGSYKEQDKYEGGGNTISRITTWNVKYSPFTFGYKYALTDDFKLDAHLGIFASVDFAGKGKSTYSGDDEDEESDLSELQDDYDYQRFDAGLQAGIGAWWKKFNIDFTYQRGFVTCGKTYNCDLTSSNFMIRVGYAF